MHYEKSTISMQMAATTQKNNLRVREWSVKRKVKVKSQSEQVTISQPTK